MKKLLLALLMVTIASGVFAQLKVGMYADFLPELLRVTAPGGDYANINKDVISDDIYKGSGTLDILSSSSEGVIGKQSELRANLGYTGRGFAGYLEIVLDDYVRAVTGSGGFVDGDTNNVSFVSVLTQVFNEWYLQGNAGMFTAYLGRTDDHGKVARFETGIDDFLYALRIDNYGVIIPNGTVDNNNFLPKPLALDENGNEYDFVKLPYFSFSVNRRPFTFQVAGDIGSGSGIVPETDPANTDKKSYTRVNGAFRVSGERMFDLVTFDAIYKFRGGDPNTDPIDEKPAGTNITVHSFGVYANFLGVPDLGIGLGYTGLFRVYENRDSSYGDWESRTTPFFSGIDLRAQYNGFDRISITSHNNISFASTEGSGDSKKQVMPIYGGLAPLGANTGENWLALYNALSFNYSLSKQLTIALQAGNRLTSHTIDTDGSKDVIFKNRFGLTAFTAYQFNANLLLQGGLQMFLDADDYTSDANPAADVNGSMMYLAIPLRLKVIF
jgi:hypothetical protein